MKNNFFETYFQSIHNAVNDVDIPNLKKIADCIIDCSKIKKKVIIVGNGGSAAMASHVSVDLTKAANIRAINFNEADLITCFANDYGYDQWVAEALTAYADIGDIVVLISSSGRSPNIINGAIRAKEMGIKVITFSGFQSNNPLRNFADIDLWVDSQNYNFVEMTHHIWLLSIVDSIIEGAGS